MGKATKIEWTDHTFNPWWGCERVSPACKHCYAETWAHRLGLDLWSKNSARRPMSDAYWRQPLSWNKAASDARRQMRVFCASMSDVFEDRAELDLIRLRLWDLIYRTPHLDWLLLTKRPENITRLTPWTSRWPRNIWLGATVENQRWAEKRIPHLLQHPAAVLFLSCEPLLGPVNLSPWLGRKNTGPGIDWIIAGGESGHHARVMNPQWLRGLRDQCTRNGVAFHFKQWGNWRPHDDEHVGHRVRQLRDSEVGIVTMVNLGKKRSGRNLDGREWDELP
jgi:protein gp37